MTYQQVSPVSISIDCLNTVKSLAVRDVENGLETANPQLRQAFINMNREHMAMSDEWFRLMSSRGWYQVSPARPDSVARTLSHVQNITAQAQGISGQVIMQQPGQVTGTFGQIL
ncbi:MAG: spore coat protein [Bacillota bacterium]